MAKVTSKLQVTVPKTLADRLDIRPGDDIDWAISGNSLHLTPAKNRHRPPDLETRLRLFREATERQRRRQRDVRVTPADGDRGWTREELYDRGGPR